ncbi:MAG: four helix bundle protein [Candidatus Aureabacteria bacterium]|nr:four helix bundle protein [Candidatus Auribacterota bacterium]
MALARSYRELDVYKKAMKGAIEIFQVTKNFPSEEKYSLTDQIRRCSRSVCANIAEAWRKRRYKAAFINKLSDAESEAAETQVWLELSHHCGDMDKELYQHLDDMYDHIIGQLVKIVEDVDRWVLHI